MARYHYGELARKRIRGNQTNDCRNIHFLNFRNAKFVDLRFRVLLARARDPQWGPRGGVTFDDRSWRVLSDDDVSKSLLLFTTRQEPRKRSQPERAETTGSVPSPQGEG
jgi:hypothetical protein